MTRIFLIHILLAAMMAGCAVAGEAEPTLAPATPGPTGTPPAASSTPEAGDLFAQWRIELQPPSCDGTLTPAQTEGPYYTANTPERNSLLEPGMPGTHLIVAGYVLTKDCRPIANAWLDFWQADAAGAYDNQGYTLRGHQFSDAQGRYFLETVRPGEYPGRTVHIHVKVQPPGGAILTSQLYFPDVASNNSDGIFDPAALVTLEGRTDYQLAFYDFVLDVP